MALSLSDIDAALLGLGADAATLWRLELGRDGATKVHMNVYLVDLRSAKVR